MNPLTRLFGARPLLWLVPGLVALGIALVMRWPGDAGDLPSWGDRTEEEQLAMEMEQQRLEALRRTAERQAVLDAVVAGRMDLLQAAARFRHLNGALPEPGRDIIRAFFPGASDEERVCRQVIHWMRGRGADPDGGPYESAAARLKAQLNEQLRRGGVDASSLPTPSRPGRRGCGVKDGPVPGSRQRPGGAPAR